MNIHGLYFSSICHIFLFIFIFQQIFKDVYLWVRKLNLYKQMLDLPKVCKDEYFSSKNRLFFFDEKISIERSDNFRFVTKWWITLSGYHNIPFSKYTYIFVQLCTRETFDNQFQHQRNIHRLPSPRMRN